MVRPERELERTGNAGSESSPLHDAFQPRVPVDAQDTVVAVYNVNLDLETSEEQVLALQRTDVTDAPIRVAVVSYDTVLDDHSVSFEVDTSATNGRSVHVSFVDLVGDHGIEIVCRGMNAEGQQTMEVFRKSPSPTGFGLYFEAIFSLAIDGTIEIERMDRSEGYVAGYANGESFPIITLSTPSDSENLLDMIRRTYYWRFTERRYVLGSEERISGKAVEQEQLSQLYRSGADAFEPWLAGGWFLEQGTAEGSVILYFEPNGRRFTYLQGEVQEVYRWRETYKILVNRVELIGVNELVPYVRRNLYVQVDGIDRMRLLGTGPWVGSYRRMPKDMLSSRRDPASRPEADIRLAGTYMSDLGDTFTFDGKEFTLTEEGKTLTGLYAIYRTDETILELKIRDETGIVHDSRRYRISYGEETRDNRIYRTVVLTPGIVTVYGFEATGDASIRYEQIENTDE